MKQIAGYKEFCLYLVDFFHNLNLPLTLQLAKEKPVAYNQILFNSNNYRHHGLSHDSQDSVSPDWFVQ